MKIACAAVIINLKDGHSQTFLGRRHADCFWIANQFISIEEKAGDRQGFFTDKQVFVGRKQAGEIAFKAGQIDKPSNYLHSEDLY